MGGGWGRGWWGAYELGPSRLHPSNTDGEVFMKLFVLQ